MTHQTDMSACQISCSLCFSILQDDLNKATELLAGETVTVDESHSPVYLLVKQYQTYLNRHAQKYDSCLSAVWQITEIKNGSYRSTVLDMVRVTLKKGFSANTFVRNSEETTLMCAVGTHDEGLVRILLENGADAAIMSENGGMNALALAVILNETSILKLILSFGVKINEPCCNGLTPLQLSMNKSVEVSKVLLQNGADIHQVVQMQGVSEVLTTKPPLIHAVETDNLYLASILLEHGEDLNQCFGQCANSPIHMAVIQGNVDMVKMLVQYGANLNKRNKRGHTPFGLALHQKESGKGLCEVLLAAGCSLKKASIINVFQKHYPPLHIAAYLGFDFHLDVIRCLIDKAQQSEDDDKQEILRSSLDLLEESDTRIKQVLNSSERRVNLKKDEEQSFINMQALDGSTALYMAVMGGNLEIAEHLYEKGANPNLTSCNGNLLHAAVMARSRAEEVLKFASRFDFDINMLNDDGNTPLILAARNNNPNICQRLVDQGAVLDIRDGRYGETALSVSVYFGFEENAEILISHGADPDIPDSRETTAVYWAIFNHREKTLHLLLQAGVKLSQLELSQYPKNIKVMRNPKCKAMLHDYVREPQSLQHLCRLATRKQLIQVHHGRSILPAVMELPVPRKLKSLIALKPF